MDLKTLIDLYESGTFMSNMGHAFSGAEPSSVDLKYDFKRKIHVDKKSVKAVLHTTYF